MNKRTKFFWVAIGILATLALLVMAAGCAKNVTVTSTATETKTVATVTKTMPSPSPSITTSAAPGPGGAPPAGGGAPPAGGGAPPAGGGAPPAGGGAAPPPAGGGAPPAGGGAAPPPAGGGAPPAGGGAAPPPAGGGAPPPAGGADPGTPPTAGTNTGKAIPAAPVTSVKLVVTSTAVKEGGNMPDQYTRTGAKAGMTTKSPPIAWSGAPADAKSFALILNGPSLDGFEEVHWLVYNIPGTTTSLPEDVKNIGTVGQAFITPSEGAMGTYKKTINVYALSANITVADADKADVAKVRAAMEGKIVAYGALNYEFTVP